jgi:hypothetical protein
MKTIKLFALVLILTFAGSVQGQLSVNLHIGTPPSWGPSGYNGVRYYYLPDIESYYDVNTSMFIYMSGNRWIHSRVLPARYRNYDLNRGYKVVMSDYRGNTPYVNFRDHRSRYARGYRGPEQHNIGERNERQRNQVQERHEEHSNGNYNRGNDNERMRQNQRNQERENERKQNRGNDKKDGNDKENRK